MVRQLLLVKEVERSVDTNLFSNHPYNANSHPDAKVMFQAFHQVAEQKAKKTKMKQPLQVNRPHSFSHPPYSVVIKPMEPGAHF